MPKTTELNMSKFYMVSADYKIDNILESCLYKTIDEAVAAKNESIAEDNIVLNIYPVLVHIGQQIK